MLYAKVVVGLPVRGPFDYIVPENLSKKISEGARVWVDFRNKKMLGYIVGLSAQSNIKKLKQIFQMIDDSPVLDKNMLSLTRMVSRYYCCSWGEVIETALPDSIRKGKKIALQHIQVGKRINNEAEMLLIHDLGSVNKRWDIYIEHIRQAQESNKASIIVCQDIHSAQEAKSIIESRIQSSAGVIYRKKHKELEDWINIKSGRTRIIIGTRSSIFAPAFGLGLIIIDEESDPIYKQEQVPHYNAREVASMRAKLERAKLILGSRSPSLESYYAVKQNKIKYICLPRATEYPEIKTIDLKNERGAFKKRDNVISKYLQDSIFSSLSLGENVLIFLDRKGFATLAACSTCQFIIKCPRCNINLVYYFKKSTLGCRYCNFKMSAPGICPKCSSGYIKFSGMGTEKLESELSRVFPTAKIQRMDKAQEVNKENADLFLSTRLVIKRANFNFDLMGILGIDNSLNRVDFRATEKTFALLMGLLNLTKKKMLIQTRHPNHHCFQALNKKDALYFYEQELKERKQLGFPPFKHLAIVKLRGVNQERVSQISHKLFEHFSNHRDKIIKIISVNPGQPSKLRGKFYWQILISSKSVIKLNKFIKLNLKNFSHSDIIMTVDIDPM